MPDPHKFEVRADGGNTKHDIISAATVASFLNISIRMTFIPDPPGDPTGHNQKADAAKFYETTGALKRNGFDALKRGIKINSAG